MRILQRLALKNKFVMKNVSDFVKTVETGVDPRQENLIPLIAGNFSNQLQNKLDQGSW